MTAAARMLVDALREVLTDDEARAEIAPVLAELVAQAGVSIVPASAPPLEDGWLDTRAAAAYLGTSVNALHKATAARDVRFEQECAGGRCWFKRADLDAWRQRSQR